MEEAPDRVSSNMPIEPGNPQTDKTDHRIADVNPLGQRIWDEVSRSPLHSLWDCRGTSFKIILQRTFKSFMDDNLLSRAAELGYYFLFALFPMLLSASSIIGLAAKRAHVVYAALLNYLAIVIPHSAFQMVIDTFNQTAQAATGAKIIFGIVAALWSASVGFGAIQDTGNIVYKVKETRPYWKAKLQAIAVTLLLSIIISVTLGVLLFADYLIKRARLHPEHPFLVISGTVFIHFIAWTCVLGLLMLLFAVIYYFAPDVQRKVWSWLTPGAALGIAGWLAASIGLRVYLHYFDSYTATYGSLGAVIILLTWFYITGLMLLIGAEFNSEIAAAVAEKKVKEQGALPPQASTDPEHPILDKAPTPS